MITNTINIAVASALDTAPWDWVIYDNNNSGCVSFSPASGTEPTNVISVTLSYNDDSCLDEVDVRLKLTGAGGCTDTKLIPISTICNSFSVSGINWSAPFSFSVDTTGGTGDYTYDWYYDTNYLDLQIPGSDTDSPGITLIPSNSMLPVDVPIMVTVSDTNGCSNTLNYNFTPCKPVAEPLHVLLICNTVTGGSENNTILVPVTACNGINIDWSTFTFQGLPGGFSYNQPNSDSNLISISVNDTVSPADYTLQYVVKDEYGVLSNIGTMLVRVTECDSTEPVLGIAQGVFQVPCGLSVTDTYDISISDLVIPNTDVDWDSLIFTLSGTDQAASVLGLVSGYDHVVTPNLTYNSTTRIITYELPAITGNDSFNWSISNNDGVSSNTTFYTIILDCSAGPTAVADADSASCGVPVVIDLIANDTITNGTINPASIIITENPTNGSVTANTDGTATYISDVGYFGVDTFKYRVSDLNSPANQSNEATVTINVLCAGTATQINVCN